MNGFSIQSMAIEAFSSADIACWLSMSSLDILHPPPLVDDELPHLPSLDAIVSTEHAIQSVLILSICALMYELVCCCSRHSICIDHRVLFDMLGYAVVVIVAVANAFPY